MNKNNKNHITDHIKINIPSDNLGIFFEVLINKIYTSIVKSGDYCIDLGSSYGRHTWPLLKTVGNTGKVFAVDALPELTTLMGTLAEQANTSNLEIHHVAVGRTKGEGTFCKVTEDSGYSGLRKRKLPDGWSENVTYFTVAITLLDDLLKDRAHPIKFIKADLEGGELDALRGGRSILAQDRPTIVFEHGGQNAAQLYGFERQDFFNFFADHDYNLFDLFGRPFEYADWDKSGVPWYLIACPSESQEISYISGQYEDDIKTLCEEFAFHMKIPALEAKAVCHAAINEYKISPDDIDVHLLKLADKLCPANPTIAYRLYVADKLGLN